MELMSGASCPVVNHAVTGVRREEGAPARNQIAINASKMRQPNEDVGMKGQIALP